MLGMVGCGRTWPPMVKPPDWRRVMGLDGWKGLGGLEARVGVVRVAARSVRVCKFGNMMMVVVVALACLEEVENEGLEDGKDELGNAGLG